MNSGREAWQAVDTSAGRDEPESGTVATRLPHHTRSETLNMNALQEYLLSASDVCNNCLRVVRVERIDPTTVGGPDADCEATYERHRSHTVVDHGPAATVSDQQGTFCDRCGTESPYDRIWDDRDIDREWFGTLVTNMLETLAHEDIDVSVDRERTAGYALQMYDQRAAPRGRGVDRPRPADDPSINECLAAGMRAGWAVATARHSTARAATVAGD